MREGKKEKKERKSYGFLDFLNTELQKDREIFTLLKRMRLYHQEFDEVPPEIAVSFYLMERIKKGPREVLYAKKSKNIFEFIFNYREYLFELQEILSLFIDTLEERKTDEEIDDLIDDLMGQDYMAGRMFKELKMIADRKPIDDYYSLYIWKFDFIRWIALDICDYNRSFSTYMHCSHCYKYIVSPDKTQESNYLRTLDPEKPNKSDNVYCSDECKNAARNQRRNKKRRELKQKEPEGLTGPLQG